MSAPAPRPHPDHADVPGDARLAIAAYLLGARR